MARIRTIKPEFFTDEDMATVSETAMILAMGILTYADDYGYFNANEKLIKAALFPLRDADLDKATGELVAIGYLQIIEHSGKKYGRVVNFQKHQYVNRPTPSRIVELNLNWGTNEDSLNPHGAVTEDSRQERKGKERKGKEENIKEESLTTEEECAEYAEHLQLPKSEGLKFFNYHESTGWVYGRNKKPITDRKRAMGTWKTNYLEKGGKLVKPEMTLDEAYKAMRHE